MAEEPRGLTAAEVAERVARGDVNADVDVKTRSVRQIVRENVCTLFNAINVILAVFVLFTGSYKNMLFMIVIVSNVIIGIVQEIRSKRTTDRLPAQLPHRSLDFGNPDSDTGSRQTTPHRYADRARTVPRIEIQVFPDHQSNRRALRGARHTPVTDRRNAAFPPALSEQRSGYRQRTVADYP